MRINCHTHIFNFQSVFSQHSVQTLVNRILEMSPPVLADQQIQRLIEGFMDTRTTPASPEKRLAGWLIDFQESDTLVDFFSKTNADTLKRLERAKERLAALADRENLLANGRLLDELVAESDDADAGKKSVADFIDFLQIGFLPSIQAVADEVMGQTPDDAGIVALTMDITRSDLFEEQFIDQLEETAAAAARYPGRIFPFVAVNPNRSSHYAHMQRALTELKFTGVKLYPSLGYDLDSPAMDRVFAYCHTNGVPLLMHCSKGGFYYAEQYIDNSAPAHWEAILGKYPNLRICFGHFGGGGALTGPTLPGAETWAGQILNLMETRPGVFADIAYHDEPMEGGAAEARYFKNLERLLEKDTIQDRVLFGTDFFMNRVRLKDRNHWSYFEDHLGGAFDTISADNPQRFLFPS